MSVRKVNKVSFTPKEVPYFFTEDAGFLEADDHESTYQISQKEIVRNVDITSATKHFDLSLPQLGPYQVDYFSNGRSLLLGGRNGHVAVLDPLTKDLKCEFNVRESVHAVQWLHMPTLFAVAQANWTYVYDENGTEIHCLKRFHQASALDFLPYHFLLVGASSATNFLTWLDISTGQLVANYRLLKTPRVCSLTHNPANAITITGHPNGTVKLWSPNVPNQPLVSLLTHPAAIRDIAVDQRGTTMVTTAADRSIRLWDLRNVYKCLQSFKLRTVPSKVELSQRNLLAVASGDLVEVYKLFAGEEIETPYMRHRMDKRGSLISSLQFCPYEDVLGVGHQGGFTSLLIPGAGEPNFDAFEANPYMSRTQRREMEVKALLDKVNHELITLDSDFLATVSSNSRPSNPHIDVLRAAEKKGRRKKKMEKYRQPKPVDATESDAEGGAGDDEDGSTSQVRRPPLQLDSFKPSKRGKKKKMSQKIRGKAAVKEQARRRLVTTAQREAGKKSK